MEPAAVTPAEPPRPGPAWPGALLRHWRGEVPAARLFWRDTVLIGTLVNLGFSLAALLLLGSGFPIQVITAVHFATLPYNLFLLVVNWRAARHAAWFRGGALVWFAAALLV